MESYSKGSDGKYQFSLSVLECGLRPRGVLSQCNLKCVERPVDVFVDEVKFKLFVIWVN